MGCWTYALTSAHPPSEEVMGRFGVIKPSTTSEIGTKQALVSFPETQPRVPNDLSKPSEFPVPVTLGSADLPVPGTG